MSSNNALASFQSQPKRRKIAYLPISTIDSDIGPGFERDEPLIANIARHGLVQPLIVIPAGEEYQVVSGQKQFACCLILHAEGRLPEGDSLPCIVESPDDIDEILLAEYFQRRELDVLYEAELMDALRSRLGLTAREGEKILAEHLILTEGYVRSTLKLLALPEEIKSQWKQEGKLYLKRTQLLEIGRKKPEEQIPAWNSALNKAMQEKKRPSSAEPDAKQSVLESAMKNKSAITFKARPENITFANALQTRKAAEAATPLQPSPPVEMAAERTQDSHDRGSEVFVTVHDFQELRQDSTARQPRTPLVEMPGPSVPAVKATDNDSEDDRSLLQIDLEDQLPDFGFAITAILHDLSKFNPARYKVRNKEALIEALEVFVTELTETARVARDVKMKLATGPEAAKKQFAELRKKAGAHPAQGNDAPVDLSRNSFNEVIEQIIQNLPAEELKRLEKTFQDGMQLNPTLKKRNPQRYGQILHGLLIDYFMDQVCSTESGRGERTVQTPQESGQDPSR